MKRRSLIISLGTIVILSLASFTAFKGKAPKQRAFLEVAGKPVFEAKETKGIYQVSLIYLNRVIDTMILTDGEQFEFKLEKNVIYSVKIEKPGFLPKLISIDTRMPELYKEHLLYKFQFEVEMYAKDLEQFLDADDVDFPIAVVAYDEKSDSYDYSRKYTECVIQRFDEAKKVGGIVVEN
jgi:hypothetical protein